MVKRFEELGNGTLTFFLCPRLPFPPAQKEQQKGKTVVINGQLYTPPSIFTSKHQTLISHTTDNHHHGVIRK